MPKVEPSPTTPPALASPAKARVLVVDDQQPMADAVADGLRDRGYDVVATVSSHEALALLTRDPFDALITDLRMPEMDGLELVASVRRLAPECQILVMTAFSAVDTAVESIRKGAYHYLTKPFKMGELALFLERALSETTLLRETKALRRALGESAVLGSVPFVSAAMRQTLSVVERVADADVPVLVLGETGTGKGVIARAIHAASARAKGPFVTLNCAAVPEALLESELFGHVKGAFTGAAAPRPGVFVEASSGTLFLDEVGEMAPALQAKLLHVLESGTVRPLGGTGERAVDVRIVAATHRDLRAAVARGAFRQDLLYRLEVVSLEIPPLRHRRDDIPIFVARFLEAARARHPKSPVVDIGPEALKALLDHDWPGNVRELLHAVERAVLLGRGPLATPADLPPSVVTPRTSPAPMFTGEVIPARDLQRKYAAWALEQLGGRKMLTCEKLGIEPKTLARWLEPPKPDDD